MKIVISPAKSLDFETALPTSKYSQPQFLEQAEKLNSVLKKKKPKALSELMSISDKLAELNWERNQNFGLPFTPDNARPAVYAFNGDVYQGLDAYTVPEDKLDRLQDTLRILSRSLRGVETLGPDPTVPIGNGHAIKSGPQKEPLRVLEGPDHGIPERRTGRWRIVRKPGQ